MDKIIELLDSELQEIFQTSTIEQVENMVEFISREIVDISFQKLSMGEVGFFDESLNAVIDKHSKSFSL